MIKLLSHLQIWFIEFAISVMNGFPNEIPHISMISAQGRLNFDPLSGVTKAAVYSIRSRVNVYSIYSFNLEC